jgi:hypothetical protein
MARMRRFARGPPRWQSKEQSSEIPALSERADDGAMRVRATQRRPCAVRWAPSRCALLLMTGYVYLFQHPHVRRTLVEDGFLQVSASSEYRWSTHGGLEYPYSTHGTNRVPMAG